MFWGMRDELRGEDLVKGNDRLIGGFQSGSVIYIEGLKLQAGRLSL